MKKKNTDSTLYFIAAMGLIIAALAGGHVAFYPIACCMIILGITNRGKNSKK